MALVLNGSPLPAVMNLLPIVGVLFAGWDVGMLLVLFWFETLIRGLANGLKHLFGIPLWHSDWRRDERSGERIKLIAAALFMVLFYVCVVLLMSYLLAGLMGMVILEELWGDPMPVLWAWDQSAQLRHAVLIMAIGYCAEAVFDLFRGYWRSEVWPVPMDDKDSFHKHYMIMHFGMIFGGAVALFTGTEGATGILLVIIALKLWMDLKHARGSGSEPDPAMAVAQDGQDESGRNRR